jgi:hypothetical protein
MPAHRHLCNVAAQISEQFAAQLGTRSVTIRNTGRYCDSKHMVANSYGVPMCGNTTLFLIAKWTCCVHVIPGTVNEMPPCGPPSTNPLNDATSERSSHQSPRAASPADIIDESSAREPGLVHLHRRTILTHSPNDCM